MKNRGLTSIPVLCPVARSGTRAKYALNCPIFQIGTAKSGIKPGKSLSQVFYFLDSGMCLRVGTQVKYGCLRVVGRQDMGCPPQKKRLPQPVFFPRGIPMPISCIPRNKQSRLASNVISGVGRSAAGRQIRQDGTGFEAKAYFLG